MGAVTQEAASPIPDWASRGDGDGDGYGYGYGDGDGYGHGYSYGDGDGDGDGDGYGYGYGDGDGDGAYWLATISLFAEKWAPAQRDRLEQLKADGARIAFWRSSADGSPANGGQNKKSARPGLVEEEPGPLSSQCGRGQLHATLTPPKWQGERVWVVALIGEVRGDEGKLWALKREIIGECL